MKDQNIPDTFALAFLGKLAVFARSIRFWLTLGAVILIFAITGPYGTGQSMSFAPRLAFWTMTHGAAWSAAILSIVGADVLLRDRMSSQVWRLLVGAVFSALPIGFLVAAIRHSWFAEP